MRRLLALLASGLVLAGSTSVATALGRSLAKPSGTFAGCPAGVVAVPQTYRVDARRAARRFLRTTYAKWNELHHWRMRLAGAQVEQPTLVTAWLPSGWIKQECGTLVWLRSVAVAVSFPAMEYPNPVGPCNACAHVVFLLSKSRRGWVAWGSY